MAAAGTGDKTPEEVASIDLLKRSEKYGAILSTLASKMWFESKTHQSLLTKNTYNPSSADFCLAVTTKEELKLAMTHIQLYNESKIVDVKEMELMKQKQRKDLSDSLGIPINYQIGLKLFVPNDKKKGFFLFTRMDDINGCLLRFLIWNRLIQRFSFGSVTEIENDGIVGVVKSIHASNYTIWLKGKWSWKEIHLFKEILIDVIRPFYSDSQSSIVTSEVIVMTAP
jgi:hypothetical protein